MKERWSQDELDFAVRRVTVDRVPPNQIVTELNAKFPGCFRTYNGIKSVLWSKGIKITDFIVSKEITPSVVGAPPLKANGFVDVPEELLRERLSSLGYKIEKMTPDKTDREFRIDPKMFEGDTYRFGVLSCTHIGSMYQQLTYLRAFYKLLEDRGIKVALHCGDLVDGMNVYKGQEFELFLHGLDAQVNYSIENYPKLAGGKTYIIDGNHDYDFVARAGADPLVKIAAARPDIEYLGAYGAYPKIGPLKIYLQHGGKGNAYARSYRLQKNIEQFSPQAKPDIYFLGHFHTGVFLPEYRNVVSAQVPCFQSQTPFERRHGLYPEIAGLIVEATINDIHRKNGLVNVKMEWVPFYVPKIKDY